MRKIFLKLKQPEKLIPNQWSALIVVFLVLSYITYAVTTRHYMRDNTNLSGENKLEMVGIESKYIFEDSNGNKYPIFISNDNSCYIIKTSQKTGKQYKYFLPKEVCAFINQESNHN